MDQLLQKEYGDKSASRVIVRYNEIALKRGNRRRFENALIKNIKEQLKHKGVKHGRVYRIPGRVIVEAEGSSAAEMVSNVFGVSSTSPAAEVCSNMDSLRSTALSVFSETKPRPKSFRITVRRLDKSLEHTSQELESLIGQHVVDATGCSVSLNNPSLDIGFEVTKDKAYVYTKRLDGLGGLPVGVSGRVLVLLSGGIDSPVAAWLCLRRGCDVALLHFLHEDYTNKVPSKIQCILQTLKEYCPGISLVCVPAQAIERELVMKVPAKYRIVVLRRVFHRIAEKFCLRDGFIAVASGDNIGQVASQTLDNMKVIDNASPVLWIRPLECYNKQEIIDLSKRISTYDLSIQEYVDCCNFLVPRHPSTAADADLIKELESHIPEDILETAFNNSFRVK